MYTRRVWRQTIFVLTFVNDSPHKDDSQREPHQQTIQNIRQQLHHALQIDGTIANSESIPLLTAGYNRGVLPHETEEWNESIFNECRKRGAYKSEGPLLYKGFRPLDVQSVIKHLEMIGYITVGGLVGFIIGAIAFSGKSLGSSMLSILIGGIIGYVIYRKQK